MKCSIMNDMLNGKNVSIINEVKKMDCPICKTQPIFFEFYKSWGYGDMIRWYCPTCKKVFLEKPEYIEQDFHS